tara:strand:- start:674 stop:1300 length:627 start_codon:yes stop_codon:yes gene_type:complete
MSKKMRQQNYLDALYEIDRRYDDGMAYVSEDETFRQLIPALGLDGGNFETLYRSILESNNYEWDKSFGRPKIDYENHERQLGIEFKTLNKQYQRGKIDEYLPKKLFDDAATQAFINPFPQNNQKSVASTSVIGDIEKLSLLPKSYTKMIWFHLWDNDVYKADVHLDMLDYMVNKYYDVESCRFEYNDSINEMSTRCNIIIYKIIAKKA